MGEIRVGICSWTERTLVTESDFYPPSVRTAEARLRYYSSQFPIVEVDSGFYSMPVEDNAVKWVERTPPGFVFNIKAFRLLTLHPCLPGSLPKDLHRDLPDDIGAKPHIYWRDLPEAVQIELLERFRQAQRPLHFARKLGCILIQLPKWIFPDKAAHEHLAALRHAWPDYRIAVEFRDVSWVSEKNIAETMAFLTDHDLTYVCVDEPQLKRTLPPLVEATTPDLAVVRFHGRNAETWNKLVDSAAERFKYLYGQDELGEWLPRLHSLTKRADQTHALMNNCYRDFGVRNAHQLTDLLWAQAA